MTDKREFYIVKCPNCKRLIDEVLLNRGCWTHNTLMQIKRIFGLTVEHQPEKYYINKRKKRTKLNRPLKVCKHCSSTISVRKNGYCVSCWGLHVKHKLELRK